MSESLHWLHVQHVTVHILQSPKCVHMAGDEEGPFWQRPWRLRAGVMYGWRAHRQRLTAIAAHPNELLVATAGRGHVGGQDQEVVRCWNLADAAAGVTCTPLLLPMIHLHSCLRPIMMPHALCLSSHVCQCVATAV